MRKLVLPVAVLAAAIAVIVLLVTTVFSHADTASIDARVAAHHYPLAPDYDTKLPLLGTDRTQSLSAFHGRVVLVNFYASWCDPCHAEAPLMAREARLLAAHGGTLVGITYQNASSATEQFDRQYGLHNPVLRDVTGQVARAFGTYQVPESFVVDPQGRIVALERNEIDQAWLNANVAPLLRSDGGARGGGSS